MHIFYQVSSVARTFRPPGFPSQCDLIFNNLNNYTRDPKFNNIIVCKTDINRYTMSHIIMEQVHSIQKFQTLNHVMNISSSMERDVLYS